jgi:hypothetical protein
MLVIKRRVSSTGRCNIMHVAPIRENIDDGTHWTAWTFRCPKTGSLEAMENRGIVK